MTLTYPDAAVADYGSKNFIPLQINMQSGSDLAVKYRAFWHQPSLFWIHLALNTIGSMDFYPPMNLYHNCNSN